MKIVIIEDEERSASLLIRTIEEIRPEDKVIAVLNSVQKAVKWFKRKTCDLVFLDIELSDGNSFKIFEKQKIKSPIIFTTAYNEYALDAFRVNSIAYLLKPIRKNDLKECFDKLSAIKQEYVRQSYRNFDAVQSSFLGNQYRSKFLVSKGEKLIALNIKDIKYFHAIDRFAFAVISTGDEFLINQTLEELEDQLDPYLFFRLNRQVIAYFDAIKEVQNHFKTRYRVSLDPAYKGGEIVVSTNKSKLFFEWANR